MIDDEVLAEIRRHRERVAARFGHDVGALSSLQATGTKAERLEAVDNAVLEEPNRRQTAE
jgi:hypothetical protein